MELTSGTEKLSEQIAQELLSKNIISINNYSRKTL